MSLIQCIRRLYDTMIKTIDEMEGLIYLEDGTVFKGRGFGAKGTGSRTVFTHR